MIAARRALAVTAVLVAMLAAPTSAAAVPAFGGVTQLAGAAGCFGDFDPMGCTDTFGTWQNVAVAVSPDGTNVYVASQASGSVAVYRRDPATGTLAQLPGISGCVSEDGTDNHGGTCADGRALEFANAVAVSPDGKNVYVGAKSTDGLAVLARDSSTGAVTQLPGAAGCVTEDGTDPFDNNPATTCVNGEGLSVGIDGFAIPAAGGQVYAIGGANNGGTIAVLDRNADTGALTQTIAGTEGCLSFDGSGGQCATVAALNGPRKGAFSPGDAHLYVALSFTDGVARFNRTAATGNLSFAASTATPTMNGANDVAVSPDGKHVYVSAFESDTVVRFNRDAGGALILQGCISHTGAGCAGNIGKPLDGVNAIAIAPDGQHVYSAAADGGLQGGIAALGRSADTGALTQLAGEGRCVSSNGTGGACATGRLLTRATDVAVSPDGASAFIVGDGIAVFARELPPACSGSAITVPNGGTVNIALACTDPNGDALTREIVNGPQGGTLGAVDQAAATVAYTARAGFAGVDNFKFRATDGTEASPLATVSLVVAPDTTAPLVEILGRRLRLTRTRRIAVRLRCPAAEVDGCRGRLTLRSARRVRVPPPGGASVRASQRRRARVLKLGSRAFTIAAGRTARVKVKVPRRGAVAIRRLGRLRVRATASARDQAGNVGVRRKRLIVRPVRARRGG
jgi:6-phosphogluconolactonase (cycloisomerase 2 family)